MTTSKEPDSTMAHRVMTVEHVSSSGSYTPWTGEAAGNRTPRKVSPDMVSKSQHRMTMNRGKITSLGEYEYIVFWKPRWIRITRITYSALREI